jgi:hypothetical protein
MIPSNYRRRRAALTVGAVVTAGSFLLTLGPAAAFAATPDNVADNGSSSIRLQKVRPKTSSF